jgi:hypothetical protein
VIDPLIATGKALGGAAGSGAGALAAAVTAGAEAVKRLEKEAIEHPLATCLGGLGLLGCGALLGARYCLTSNHLLECIDRFDVAAAGVLVITAGVIYTGVGCGVGVATTWTGIGPVVLCVSSGAIGGIIVTSGGMLVYHAFTPWHERREGS